MVETRPGHRQATVVLRLVWQVFPISDEPVTRQQVSTKLAMLTFVS